jgi:hypothetical protein
MLAERNQQMLPILTIIIIAIIGALAYGIIGFVLFGIGGYIVVTLFGVLLHKFRGGFVPPKVRRKTALDFFAAHRDSVAQAYPGMPDTACVEELAKLIENMVDHAAMQTPATAGVEETLSYGVFVPLASEVAAKQATPERRQMADELIGFLTEHELWFRRREQ